MKKQIVIKIELDQDKDEFMNVITTSGFEEEKPNQTALEVIGLLETVKQQELKKLSDLIKE